MTQYFKVEIRNLPEQHQDSVSGIAFMYGASGLAENLRFTQKDLSYDPDIRKSDSIDLDVYFETDPSLEFFEKVRKLSPLLQCQLVKEESKDWLSEWKKGFNAFEFAKPYWIVPSWSENPCEEKYCIRIDPGMAFGTGTHATTKMCGHFLKKVASNNQSMLDVGTGTAVLAILAEKLGFEIVHGIEIDPEARRVARENIQGNNCSRILISEHKIEELNDSYDVIVANIIHGVLLNMKHDLFRNLKSQGQLFVTGILLEYEDEFIQEFIEALGFKITKRFEQDGWVGFWLEKP